MLLPTDAAPGLRIACLLQITCFAYFLWSLCCSAVSPVRFSKVPSDYCLCPSPNPCLLGCLLRLTFCTPKASTAICLASLWMPHTATWLHLRVLAKHVWAGNWTLTVTCPLPVLTVSFCLVYYLNPPHGQHYTCWNSVVLLSKVKHCAPQPQTGD